MNWLEHSGWHFYTTLQPPSTLQLLTLSGHFRENMRGHMNIFTAVTLPFTQNVFVFNMLCWWSSFQYGSTDITGRQAQQT